MIQEMRIYSFSDAKQVDTWIDLFGKLIVPAYESLGVKVPAYWKDPEKNQVIWFRVFKDAAQKQKVDVDFPQSEGFKKYREASQAAGVRSTNMDVRVLTPVKSPF